MILETSRFGHHSSFVGSEVFVFLFVTFWQLPPKIAASLFSIDTARICREAVKRLHNAL